MKKAIIFTILLNGCLFFSQPVIAQKAALKTELVKEIGTTTPKPGERPDTKVQTTPNQNIMGQLTWVTEQRLKNMS